MVSRMFDINEDLFLRAGGGREWSEGGARAQREPVGREALIGAHIQNLGFFVRMSIPENIPSFCLKFDCKIVLMCMD